MIKKVHVRVGDEVYVRSGKDAGKTGKVLNVNRKTGRCIVEGVNMNTIHKKPRRQGEVGGILSQEGSIDSSNLMLVCSRCKRPARFGRRIEANGEHVSYCKACGEVKARSGR